MFKVIDRIITYLIFYCKEGIMSDDDNEVFQTTETFIVPPEIVSGGALWQFLTNKLNSIYGEGKWKFEYHLEYEFVENGFYIERSFLSTLEGQLFLKGVGKYDGHCHSLHNIKWLIKEGCFNKNPDLEPIFNKAIEMMKTNSTGIVFNN